MINGYSPAGSPPDVAATARFFVRARPALRNEGFGYSEYYENTKEEALARAKQYIAKGYASVVVWERVANVQPAVDVVEVR